jgi:5-methyltetrahydrofolate--homocysteine methyltransferase
MNEKGIPMTAEERLVLAKSLIDMAKQQGVKERDLVIDTLTLSLSSNQKEAMETIRALKMVAGELGLSTMLGVSNVSYGLPARGGLNQAFLTIAINAGLNAAIINPSSTQARVAIDAMNVINGHDAYGLEYIRKYSTTTASTNLKDTKAGKSSTIGKGSKTGKEDTANSDPMAQLMQAIIDGDENTAVKAVTKAVDSGVAILEIANRSMIPAIEIVGKYFKDGKYFFTSGGPFCPVDETLL